MPTRTLRALLAGLIDYAGLFPPAGLPMADVARNYDAYRGSSDAWALGRLSVTGNCPTFVALNWKKSSNGAVR